MNKRGTYLIYVILLSYLLIFTKLEKIFINGRKKKYCFIRRYNIAYKNGGTNHCEKHIHIGRFRSCIDQKQFSIKKRKKENMLLVFSKKNDHWDSSININPIHILKQLKIIKEKNKRKEKICDINFLHLLEKDGVNVNKIKLNTHNRKQYGYVKNKIREFLKEHNLDSNGNLANYLNDRGEGTKDTQNSSNRNSISNKNDSILCLHSTEEIKKGDVILDISSKYIIIFDKILSEINKFVDEFKKKHNTNYIKYILKNEKETEIKKLDSLTLLKYDIFEKHRKFKNFMNSPNVHLKCWDIKLTILISYVYFISKYVNLLLYYFNFNNTVFVSLTSSKIVKEGKILQEEKRDEDAFQRCEREEGKSIQISHIYSLKKLENEINKNTREQLENEEHFFFYKNYELYINYIIYKNKFSHLPLNFADSSFNLFNNTSIKNIVYFRKKMIHDVIELYKNDLDNQFFDVNTKLIRRILFDNNKYYQSFLTAHQDFSFNLKFPENTSEPISEKQFDNIDELYVCTLGCQTEETTEEKEDVRNDVRQCERNDGGNGKKESGERRKRELENEQRKISSYKYLASSLLYEGYNLKSLEEIFHFTFILHIYGYVCSHAIQVDRTVKNTDDLNKQRKEKNSENEALEKKGKEKGKERNNSYVTTEHILNSNVGLVKQEPQKKETENIDLLTEYNFNEFEKKEKEKEKSKYMCLIPFIDICNHNNFCHNAVIQKAWNKEVKNKTENGVEKKAYREMEKDRKYKEDGITVLCNENPIQNKSNDAYLLDLSMKLISTQEIKEGEEITVRYANMSNDLFLLEYGFINYEDTKVYFYFDINIIRQLILQVLACDQLPLEMLESLPKIKTHFFQQLGLISASGNVYERFQKYGKQERAEEIRKKNNILKEYLRKNKYMHEYNIFTIKENINSFLIKEKITFEKKSKQYLYIGGKTVVDPILLAAIRIIIFDNISYLSKLKIEDILKWDNYLSVESEIAVIQILIKLCDEVIYRDFYDFNYEEILKLGKIKYAQLKFLQNKFFHSNLFNSEEKCINVFEDNNFLIVMYNVMKLKSIKKAKNLLANRSKELKKIINN